MTTDAGVPAANITLPALNGIPDRPVSGRVPLHGYQRGWGLQFGGLADQVIASPLYQEAVAARGEIQTWVDARKAQNLFVLITQFLPRLPVKNIIEFGTYRGGNALFMGRLLQSIDPEAKLYALDTFTGMPKTDETRDAHRAGDFKDANLELFQEQIYKAGLQDTIFVVQGMFEDTLPSILAADEKFGMAHIDCDIYSGVKYAQESVWSAMTVGGYIVYDDADVSSCIGATEAVEELIMDRRIHSEQIWPHFVFRTGL